MNQRQATTSTLLAILDNRGVDYQLGGETPISQVLTPKDKEEAREALFVMFKSKQVTYKPEFQSKVDNDTELKKYISGLVNNWIRKAKEFNGGEQYKAKNPGSRAGSQDPQVKEMRKLLSITEDADAKAAIQAAIDSKVQALKAEKNQVEINADLLPAHLRDLLK